MHSVIVQVAMSTIIISS